MTTEETAPKIIRRTVILQHPDTQERVTLRAGDELPEWAVPLVSNPKVFQPEESTSLDLPAPSERSGMRVRQEYVDAEGNLVVHDSDKRVLRTAGL